jgi:hypothetical protein
MGACRHSHHILAVTQVKIPSKVLMREDSISDLRPPVFSAVCCRFFPSSLLLSSLMTSSPTSVIAQFREFDNIAFSLAHRTYESESIKEHLIREQQKKIIAAERVKMLSWELTAAKEAVVVMTCLLPNAKR